MKNYINFNTINENKYYIYSRVFRINDLLEQTNKIYKNTNIEIWMKKYNFDKFATALFITDNKINNIDDIDIRQSSKDIKNKKYFSDTSKKYNGTKIIESEIIRNNEKIYLYVFKKNPNKARQNHGFKYEYEMRKLNNINKPPYTAKWDAVGSISKKLFDERILEGKTIEFNSNNITWDDLDEQYKNNYLWNIKCIGKGNSVDLGAFTRISGLDSKTLKPIVDDISIQNIKDEYKNKFIFNVCFYNKENKANRTEYFVFIDIDTWRTYLPHDIDNLEEMYRELQKHRLSKTRVRTNKTEQSWREYIENYSKITEHSDIKLRFKRDSKGQLRIQSSMSYNIFMSKILKNPHIKIY